MPPIVLPMQATTPWEMLPSLQQYEIGTSEFDPFIGVEMAIADHPPHRSERALLTHSAPTSSIDVEPMVWPRVQHAR